MRIGILGGTFDPVHKGHMDMAKQAMVSLHLDEVWILPAGTPPHKSNEEISTRINRYEMCCLAFSHMDKCFVKNLELYSLNSQPNYTYLTMEALRETYVEDEFYFLMGQDSIDYFEHWVHPQRILNACKIGVFLRDTKDEADGYEAVLNKIDELNKRFLGEIIPISYLPTQISSTKIRKMVCDGKSKDELLNYLDASVYDYIVEKRLYLKKENYDIKEMKSRLKKTLQPSRYEHTLGVSDTAFSLANYYGYPSDVAYVAGLLHDCAKYMTNDELLSYCKKYALTVTEGEKKAPHLLHAKAGSYMAKHEYQVNNNDILHAILVHTTGCANMNLLDKIVFVADYIEPGRDKAKRLNEIRQMAYYNLDFAVLMILEDTIDYIEKKEQFLDGSTKETYDYYLKEIDV